MDDHRLWVIRLGKQKDFTEEVIRDHVEHLRRLDDAGRLVLAGPFENQPPGGLVIIRAATEQEALATAEADPFIAQGFESFELRPMLHACRANNYLLD